MLYFKHQRKLLPWSKGSALLFVDEQRPSGTMLMAVRCRLGSLPEELSMLDTGAHWTLIGSETIELLGDELGEGVGEVKMSTRLGTFSGTLHRLPIHLPADQGEPLMVDGTCLALRDWRGPDVLGVHGFLERLRFAIEPGGPHSEPRIHFGPP